MSADADEGLVPAVSPEPENHEETGAANAPDHLRVTVVDHDPPMLRLEIDVRSWERGDSDTRVIVSRRGELAELLRWAPLEQRRLICGNLRARIQHELGELFAVLEGWRPDGTDVEASL